MAGNSLGQEEANRRARAQPQFGASPAWPRRRHKSLAAGARAERAEKGRDLLQQHVPGPGAPEGRGQLLLGWPKAALARGSAGSSPDAGRATARLSANRRWPPHGEPDKLFRRPQEPRSQQEHAFDTTSTRHRWWWRRAVPRLQRAAARLQRATLLLAHCYPSACFHQPLWRARTPVASRGTRSRCGFNEAGTWRTRPSTEPAARTPSSSSSPPAKSRSQRRRRRRRTE